MSSLILLFHSALLGVALLSLSQNQVLAQDDPPPKECRFLQLPGWSDVNRVCYLPLRYAMSSIGTDGNGTENIQATYGYNYNFYDGETLQNNFVNVAVTKNIFTVQFSNGTVISKTSNCGDATINGVQCASCSICDEEIDNPKFSADCTNIAGGRVATCESTDPVFLPMTDDLFNGIEMTTFSYVKRRIPRKVVSFRFWYSATKSVSTIPCGDSVYQYDYNLYKRDDASSSVGMLSISRTNDMCDFVQFNGANCTSCSFCGEETDSFSADCRNLPNGRAVKCEPSTPVFYPFNKKLMQRKPKST